MGLRRLSVPPTSTVDARAERRSQLLSIARRRFEEDGFAGTSVSKIVREAGVAQGTFYLYFQSKESLFLELLDDLMEELRSGIKGVDPTSKAGVRDQLPGVIGRVLATVAEASAVASPPSASVAVAVQVMVVPGSSEACSV